MCSPFQEVSNFVVVFRASAFGAEVDFVLHHDSVFGHSQHFSCHQVLLKTNISFSLFYWQMFLDDCFPLSECEPLPPPSASCCVLRTTVCGQGHSWSAATSSRAASITEAPLTIFLKFPFFFFLTMESSWGSLSLGVFCGVSPEHGGDEGDVAGGVHEAHVADLRRKIYIINDREKAREVAYVTRSVGPSQRLHGGASFCAPPHA